MDIRLANYFVSATYSVFETMVFLKPIPERPFLKKDNMTFSDVSGTVGITGLNVKLKGAFTIGFTKGAILKIILNMLGEEHAEINNEVCDAVGELTNMISGQARQRLSENGGSFEASIPTIIVGNGQVIHHLKLASVIIPFDLEGEKFFVDICFDN